MSRIYIFIKFIFVRNESTSTNEYIGRHDDTLVTIECVRFVYNTVMPNECVNYMHSNDKQRENEFEILFQDKWNVSSRGRKLILDIHFL